MWLMQHGRVGCTHQPGGSARLGEDSLVDPEHDARAQRLWRQAHRVRQLRRRPLRTRLNRQSTYKLNTQIMLGSASWRSQEECPSTDVAGSMLGLKGLKARLRQLAVLFMSTVTVLGIGAEMQMRNSE